MALDFIRAQKAKPDGALVLESVTVVLSVGCGGGALVGTSIGGATGWCGSALTLLARRFSREHKTIR